jgi:hypothetical protein
MAEKAAGLVAQEKQAAMVETALAEVARMEEVAELMATEAEMAGSAAAQVEETLAAMGLVAEEAVAGWVGQVAATML